MLNQEKRQEYNEVSKIGSNVGCAGKECLGGILSSSIARKECLGRIRSSGILGSVGEFQMFVKK